MQTKAQTQGYNLIALDYAEKNKISRYGTRKEARKGRKEGKKEGTDLCVVVEEILVFHCAFFETFPF